MLENRIQKTERQDEREGLKTTFHENLNVVNGLCESLKSACDYRLRVLEELKEQLRSTSMWRKV
jgi:hypothetical protein